MLDMWICITVSFAAWHDFSSMLHRRDRALEVAPEVVDEKLPIYEQHLSKVK